LINGACLSREAQEALVGELREMGPIQPHHMQEARRQLNQTDAAVMDKPKSMFLRKRFRWWWWTAFTVGQSIILIH